MTGWPCRLTLACALALGACGGATPLEVGAAGASGSAGGAAGSAGSDAGAAGAVDVAQVPADAAIEVPLAVVDAASTDVEPVEVREPVEAGDVEGAVPPCTSVTADSLAMNAMTFCEIFLSLCGANHAGYDTLASCIATYAATPPHRKQCQSYHVCNADHVTGASRMIHCGHAAAESVCTQVN